MKKKNILIFRIVVYSLIALMIGLYVFFLNHKKEIENKKKSKEYYLSGQGKFLSRDFSGALEDLSLAIKLNDDDWDYFLERGKARIYMKQYELAIDDFNKCMKTKLKNKGEDYTEDKDRINSGEKLSLETNGRIIYMDIMPFVGRGVAKYHLGNYKSAIMDFDKCLELNKNGYYSLSMIYFYRGLCKIKLGDKKGGCEDMNWAKREGYEPQKDEPSFSEICVGER